MLGASGVMGFLGPPTKKIPPQERPAGLKKGGEFMIVINGVISYKPINNL